MYMCSFGDGVKVSDEGSLVADAFGRELGIMVLRRRYGDLQPIRSRTL